MQPWQAADCTVGACYGHLLFIDHSALNVIGEMEKTGKSKTKPDPGESLHQRRIAICGEKRWELHFPWRVPGSVCGQRLSRNL